MANRLDLSRFTSAAEDLRGAVERRDAKAVDAALSHGADPRLAADGQTPLMKATRLDDGPMVEALLRAGARLGADCSGVTPLHEAAYHGYASAMRAMVKAGVPLDAPCQSGLSRSAAVVAANRGQLECLRLLIEGGANLDQPCARGATPLSWACQGGHVQCVKLLVESGCALGLRDKDEMTAMARACLALSRQGAAACVEYLLGAGADPTLKDRLGRSCVDIAKEGGWTGMAKALRKVAAVFEERKALARACATDPEPRAAGSGMRL